MKDRTFIGLTRVHRFDDGGSIIKLGLKAEDLKAHERNGWINLIIARKKNPNNDDKDYYTYVDDFVPKA